MRLYSGTDTSKRRAKGERPKHLLTFQSVDYHRNQDYCWALNSPGQNRRGQAGRLIFVTLRFGRIRRIRSESESRIRLGQFGTIHCSRPHAPTAVFGSCRTLGGPNRWEYVPNCLKHHHYCQLFRRFESLTQVLVEDCRCSEELAAEHSVCDPKQRNSHAFCVVYPLFLTSARCPGRHRTAPRLGDQTHRSITYANGHVTSRREGSSTEMKVAVPVTVGLYLGHVLYKR
jgi:hypothetical protein|mmetsp:Transcript_74454/g.125354  ORF Transcript_74454/g.125354 Transcript_74454/m.125354 type:complete len:229 (+) Transcript_74454:788-1474(+)